MVGERAASTAIYYLLGIDDVAKWRRVDATEVWHFYAGAPLVLTSPRPGTTLLRTTLGRT
jgi:predicted cupin superfamily sugar epimerase